MSSQEVLFNEFMQSICELYIKDKKNAVETVHDFSSYLNQFQSLWMRIYENQLIFIYIIDLTRSTKQYVYCNAAIEKIMGYPPSAMLEGGFEFAASIIHPEDLQHCIDRNLAYFQYLTKPHYDSATYDVNYLENRILHKSGEIRWVYSAAYPLTWTSDGLPHLIICMMVDVTERKQLEDKLLVQQEEKYALLEEQLHATIAQIVEKKAILLHITEKVEQALRSCSGKSRETLQSLLADIRHQSSSKSGQEDFITQLHTVYGSFMAKLSDEHSDLSSAELRVCALLIAGLSTPQMASVFYLSKRTIETHRHNIRKKLGLSSTVNISKWLQQYTA